MRDLITAELAGMGRSCGVRTLLAVESGSRCWGFASPDSDYDVRFVYASPLDDYLRLEKRRDVIEWRLDDVYDVSGWDLSKFMQLMRGSNPSVFEWLVSPIVYQEAPEFSAIRQLAPHCYNPVASVYHYLSWAQGNARDFLRGDTVKLKKYLYVMRALLAARWGVRVGTPVPMEFSVLRESMLEPAMAPVVEAMVAEKMEGDEKAPHAHIPQADAWIESVFVEIESALDTLRAPEKVAWDEIDEAFRQILKRV